MSSVARPSRAGARAPQTIPALQVSAYERVASMMLSLLILIGVVVFCLFMAWLGTHVFFPPLKSVPVRYDQVGGGSPEGVIGESMQLDSPNPQDIAKESDLDEPELQDTLTTVLEAVALQQMDLDDPSLTEEDTDKKGGGSQIGDGKVLGFGMGGPGRPGIPPHMRWEINFGEGNTLDTYARILDSFGIELGVIGIGQTTYARFLSRPRPEVYTKPSKDEERLWMNWKRGRLREADRDLAARAGLPTNGRLILQFYPDETEQLLLAAEHEYKNRDASTIRKTRFGVRQMGSAYEFYVIEQTYL